MFDLIPKYLQSTTYLGLSFMLLSGDLGSGILVSGHISGYYSSLQCALFYYYELQTKSKTKTVRTTCKTRVNWLYVKVGLFSR